MTTKITLKSLKWIQAMVMTACLSLLFSPQLFAQHHGPFRGYNWNDSLQAFHKDSGGTWHDTLHFPPPPPPPPHDSIHIGNDTIIVGGDTIVLNGGGKHLPPPPPPPPHDSIIHLGGDTIVIGNDTILFPPPPPPPPHDSIIHLGGDTIVIGGDTIVGPPPPPPHDSTGCGGGHRLADPNSPAQAVIISIYPNPVMESATIHIENTSGTVTFRMYEMNGRLAMEKTFSNGDFQLNKGNFGAGVYFYEINDGNSNVSKGKLIIQ